MPWLIKEKDENFVIATEDGEEVSEHTDYKEAVVELTSLYEKGIYGPTTFEELDEIREAEEKAREFDNMVGDFSYLMFNATHDPEIDDKAGALRQLVDGLELRMNNLSSSVEKSIARMSKAFGRNKQSEEDNIQLDERAFHIFKSKDGGYRWIARYSNNRRDNDNPPEIISSYSHNRFVKMVDNSLAPKPRLWLWHEPALEWGAADWVAYDDVGFALAGGHVYPGCEGIAKSLSELPADEVRVSHGMLPWTVKRDASDPSIINEHITHEISPLPTYAAANLLTGFFILDNEVKSMISEQKKENLAKWGLPVEAIDQLETMNQKSAELADELAIDKKSAEEAEDVEETTEQVDKAQTEDVATEEDNDDDKPDTKEAQPVISAELAAVLKTVLESVVSIDNRLKSIEESESTRLAQKAAMTPLASLSALVSQQVLGSPIGSEQARVDGRTSLAKSAPEETPAPSNAKKIGIPFLDAMVN